MRAFPLLLAALLSIALAGCTESEAEPLDAPPAAADEAAPVRLLHEDRFEGSAPAPTPGFGAVQAQLPVQVPAGATRVLVTYNATYTGLWPSYVYLFDAAGTERGSSDGCDPPTVSVDVMEPYTCAIEVRKDVGPGAWMFQMTWQVGEVAEEYTVDVAVWGTG